MAHPVERWPEMCIHSWLKEAELLRRHLLRLYEKASNSGQPPHHEATHGSIYERFAART
jgi:hypothetical protein